MEYNTSQPRLIIPEYGRNVQKMVDYLSTIENREERNLQTQNLIEIIGNLNPQIRDVPDFKHKLWDHLFIMSDFKLDVDSPYPVPVPETLTEKPAHVDYPAKSARFRHYGNVLKDMVKHCMTLEDGEYKDRLVNAVANHMKKTYLIWNKDTVENEVILKEIGKLSDGKLDLSKVVLLEQKELTRSQNSSNKRNNSRSNRNNSKRKKFKSNK
tara:strand:- start:2027 stop:2659 length:633 start_codon:yes stop_codon:yes gene_type:complete